MTSFLQVSETESEPVAHFSYCCVTREYQDDLQKTVSTTKPIIVMQIRKVPYKWFWKRMEGIVFFLTILIIRLVQAISGESLRGSKHVLNLL